MTTIKLYRDFDLAHPKRATVATITLFRNGYHLDLIANGVGDDHETFLTLDAARAEATKLGFAEISRYTVRTKDGWVSSPTDKTTKNVAFRAVFDDLADAESAARLHGGTVEIEVAS